MGVLTESSVGAFALHGFDPVFEAGTRIGVAGVNRLSDEEVDDLKRLVSTPWGRRILWRLLAESRLFQSTYLMPGPGADLQMAFAEGRKQIGYKLYANVMQVAPKAYEKMVNEQKDAK